MAPKVDINSNEWVDMVFDGRNQAYGASELRKNSTRRLLKAFTIAALLFVIGVCSPIMIKLIIPKKKAVDESIREISYIKLDRPKEKRNEEAANQLQQVMPPAEMRRSTIKFTPPVIKPDEEVSDEEEPKTLHEVLTSKAAIGTVTYKGASDVEGVVVTQPVEEMATGPVTGTVTEENQEAFTIVEQMPEFPGGTEELQKYLNANIRYPAIALENGVQGRVICEFVVNADGKVVNAKVIKGVDPSLDAEALRVINSMPLWKAGKQRGKPVKVRYTLPVNFKLQ